MKKKMLLAAIAMSLSCSFMAYASTGWTEEGGHWQYYKDESTLAVDCFVKSEDSVYYLDSAGNMVTSQEIQYDGKQYTLNEQGQVVNSWVLSWDSNYYYVDENGKVLTNTTTPDGYTVGADGVWTPENSGNVALAQETEAAQSTDVQDTNKVDDEEMGYQALKSLYTTLSNPSLLSVGYIKCMDVSYLVGGQYSKNHTSARLVLIRYSTSSSFGAPMDKYYAYEVKTDGSFVTRTDPMKVYTADTLNSAENVVTLDQAALLQRVKSDAK